MKKVARRCSVKKVFFEISQNSQENTCARVSFLIKLTLAQVFSCEFCEISKNTYSYRTPQVAASVHVIPAQIIVPCFNESVLQMTKNAFHFILDALFVLKIFKCLSWLFAQIEKNGFLIRNIRLISKSITSQPG